MSYGAESAEPPVSARALLLAGSLVRIAYGVGALLTPARMVSAGLAPDTHALAEPRLTLRGFGGHQLIVGALTLAATRAAAPARRAATLSLLVDTFDIVSTVLEQHARGERDATVTRSYRLSGAGMATFACARWVLRR
ncbi:MAG TPA: hypothetical protein VED41_05280 [Solirubrobacteraceae bacterium]|nr:hypothetical protein [Solirubrobacteraceae bacterium]